MAIFNQLVDSINEQAVSFSWPGCNNVTIKMRIATEEDIHEAGVAADKLYKSADIPITMSNVEQYVAEINTQILYRVLSSAVDGSQIAPNITEFRTVLTCGAKDVLLERFEDLQAQFTPAVEVDQGKIVDTWAQAKKAPSVLQNIKSLAFSKALLEYVASLQYEQPVSSSEESASSAE
jgi:hypothetical protein